MLPINHILDKVPLMKLYLEGSTQPTIPRLLARDHGAYFEHGCADRAGQDGSCSRLFELNVHLWQYGRPQPRTMSIQQRLVRKAARLASRSQRRRAAKAGTAGRGAGWAGRGAGAAGRGAGGAGWGGDSAPHNHPLPASSSCPDILPGPALTSGCCGGAWRRGWTRRDSELQARPGPARCPASSTA